MARNDVGEVMTVAECAAYTKRSRRTIYNKVHTKRIPFERPEGGVVHFRKSSIDAWLQGKPLSEIPGSHRADSEEAASVAAVG